MGCTAGSAQMLANCTEAAYGTNKGRMVRLAEYSRDVLRDLRDRDRHRLRPPRTQGTLQLFRTQKQLDAVGDDTAVLDAYSVPYEVLDPAGCIAAEPALGLVRGKFVGGLRLPGDETGDAHLFTQRLAALCAALRRRVPLRRDHRARWRRRRTGWPASTTERGRW